MQRNLQPSNIARLFGAALLVLGLALAGTSRASSLTPMDLATLSAKADRVFVGTVEKQEAHFVSANSRYIVTDVTVRSERNLLGVPEGSRLVVRHLGGAVGEIGQRVFGEASYTVGEQVLIFAAERQGAYYALGMAQGALHVFRDSTGVYRVETQLAGAELIGPAATVAAAPVQGGRALDAVVAEVQSYLSQRPVAPQSDKSAPQRRE